MFFITVNGNYFAVLLTTFIIDNVKGGVTG